METVGAYEAKTHLPRLLDRVARGEEIRITRNGRPIARLVPESVEEAQISKPSSPRSANSARGGASAMTSRSASWWKRGGDSDARKKARARRPGEDFVLDNSICMAWSFEDETSTYADAVLDRLAKACAVVPALWPLEVANSLLMGEHRKRATEAETIKWIGILTSLPITIDDATNAHAWGDTLSLARGHNLTAYDAAYLELAIRRDLPIATLDAKLKAAAEAIGVALYEVAE